MSEVNEIPNSTIEHFAMMETILIAAQRNGGQIITYIRTCDAYLSQILLSKIFCPSLCAHAETWKRSGRTSRPWLALMPNAEKLSAKPLRLSSIS